MHNSPALRSALLSLVGVVTFLGKTLSGGVVTALEGVGKLIGVVTFAGVVS